MAGGLHLGLYGVLEDSEFVFNSHWNWFTSPAAREGAWTPALKASGKPGDKGWAKIKDGYNDTHVVRCLSHSVIRYNRISGHSNAIPVNHNWAPADHGNFDVHNNVILNTGDDCIEPDGPCHNIRVFNNKCVTCLNGFSDAPVDAGPAFVVRNVFHGFIQGAIKIRNAASGKQLFYHNTCYPYTGPEIAPAFNKKDGSVCFSPDAQGVNNMRTRNNIFVANEEPFAMRSKKSDTLDFNYDCLWVLGNKPYSRTVGESNAVKALPEFVSLEKADLRLANDSQPCVDAGEIIKGINDDVPEPYQYKGKAPDLGAYEYGTDAPHYGPRVASETR